MFFEKLAADAVDLIKLFYNAEAWMQPITRESVRDRLLRRLRRYHAVRKLKYASCEELDSCITYAGAVSHSA
jgi:hypothetical protein